MRVVVDTNAFLVMVPSKSLYHTGYVKLMEGRYDMILSGEILLEYEEQLKFRYKVNAVNEILANLLENKNILQQEPEFRWNLIKSDPDDNKFVDCAIAANADYIVTNDKHFKILKSIDFPKVKTITLQGFVAMLKKELG